MNISRCFLYVVLILLANRVSAEMQAGQQFRTQGLVNKGQASNSKHSRGEQAEQLVLQAIFLLYAIVAILVIFYGISLAVVVYKACLSAVIALIYGKQNDDENLANTPQTNHLNQNINDTEIAALK